MTRATRTSFLSLSLLGDLVQMSVRRIKMKEVKGHCLTMVK